MNDPQRERNEGSDRTTSPRRRSTTSSRREHPSVSEREPMQDAELELRAAHGQRKAVETGEHGDEHASGHAFRSAAPEERFPPLFHLWGLLFSPGRARSAPRPFRSVFGIRSQASSCASGASAERPRPTTPSSASGRSDGAPDDECAPQSRPLPSRGRAVARARRPPRPGHSPSSRLLGGHCRAARGRARRT